MRPIATDVAQSVVSVYICWTHELSCAKSAVPIEMPFGDRLKWAKETLRIDRGPDSPHWKGHT